MKKGSAKTLAPEQKATRRHSGRTRRPGAAEPEPTGRRA